MQTSLPRRREKGIEDEKKKSKKNYGNKPTKKTSGASSSSPLPTKNAKDVSGSKSDKERKTKIGTCILCARSYNSNECTHEVQICPICTRESEYALKDSPITATRTMTQDFRLESAPATQRTSTQILSKSSNRNNHGENNQSSPLLATETIFPGGVYSGNVDHDGCPHGEGKMIFEDGTIYEGGWCHSVMHGFGEMTRNNNTSSYVGNWSGGKAHGRGIQKYENGDIYEGDFVNGVLEGKGIYRYANKEVYDGNWKNGKQHGRGKHTYTSGNVYKGGFRNGRRNGNGSFIHPNGDRFYGSFRNEKKEGLGAYVKQGGILEIKSYLDGIPTGGVRFNQERDRAWMLVDGQFLEMPLKNAEAYLRKTRLQSPYLANYLW